MAFLNDKNILILEKDGLVRLVANGTLQEQPVLQTPVDSHWERGLLGIAVSNSIKGNHNRDVFLYYTEADPLRNRIYKFQWNGKSLNNATLILDLPAGPGSQHNGGKIAIGPDGYLYTVIGDLVRDPGMFQNAKGGSPPDNTGVILRVNPDNGSAAPDNPFVSIDFSSKHYAYGIRNSFGLDFDHVTGNLWDTENGEDKYDEINLVEPGFNSGWNKIMGPIWSLNLSESELVHLHGSKYSDPELSWYMPIGTTDIEFFNSGKLGKYRNNIFVGDINNGTLYNFELNKNRNGLVFANSELQNDLVVDDEDQKADITFGTGFGGITDIETGPDGSLYVLSLTGAIYKISPGLILSQFMQWETR